MTATADRLTLSDVRKAAEAVVERYTAAPASETEAAIALLALWVLDAVEAGRMTGDEADRVFVLLDVSIGELDGPQLSEGIQQLVVEGEHFHHLAKSMLPILSTSRIWLSRFFSGLRFSEQR